VQVRLAKLQRQLPQAGQNRGVVSGGKLCEFCRGRL
jgi:hypothetical protein